MADNHSLVSAVQSGDFDAVCRALETTQDINEFDEDCGVAALHVAAEDGNLPIAELLLGRGANTEVGGLCSGIGGVEHLYPIHMATINNDLPMIELLLKYGARFDTYDSQSEDKYSALHYAAYMNHVDLLKYFLEKGADVDLTNEEGWTPLMAAMHVGEKEAVHFLISKNADIYKTTSSRYNLLHLAVGARDKELTKLFLEKGIAINEKYGSNGTCLHLAAQHDDADLVELLVTHGADIEINGGIGYTPFHFAARHGHLNVMDYFLKHGARVDLPEEETGYTALHIATEHKHIESVKFLINYGANANCKTRSQGYTPLHISVKGRYVDITRFLVENGADLESKDNSGMTSLNLIFQKYVDYPEAHANDFTEMAKVILKFGLLSRSCDELLNNCVPGDLLQKLLNWKELCESELEKMKIIKISNTNMSLYSILRGLCTDTNAFTLLHNLTITKELNNITNYLRDFPIYGDIKMFIERKIQC